MIKLSKILQEIKPEIAGNRIPAYWRNSLHIVFDFKIPGSEKVHEGEAPHLTFGQLIAWGDQEKEEIANFCKQRNIKVYRIDSRGFQHRFHIDDLDKHFDIKDR